jgi:hypothetical protein
MECALSTGAIGTTIGESQETHEKGKGDAEARVDAVGTGGVDADPGEEPAIVGGHTGTCACVLV